MYDANKIMRAVDYYFNEPSLLRTAFTHSSYANEQDCASNEKLEFLGDSMLNMVVSEYLYNNCAGGKSDEGTLSILRSNIVSRRPLATAVDKLNLMQYLQCGVGETKSDKTKSEKMKCDLFEAITAAIYLDSDSIQEVEKFVFSNLGDTVTQTVQSVIMPNKPKLKTAPLKSRGGTVSNEVNTVVHERISDFKTKLQVFLQKKPNQKIEYSLVETKGVAHQPIFVMAAMVNDVEYGRGEGAKKKEAEQKAAEIAYNRLAK